MLLQINEEKFICFFEPYSSVQPESIPRSGFKMDKFLLFIDNCSFQYLNRIWVNTNGLLRFISYVISHLHIL